MTSRRVKTKAGVDEEQKRRNRTKSRVRAKVEWPFCILKRIFGLVKVRYGGLKKNHEWLCAAFALVNLYQNRKQLAKVNKRLAPQGHSMSCWRPCTPPKDNAKEENLSEMLILNPLC